MSHAAVCALSVSLTESLFAQTVVFRGRDFFLYDMGLMLASKCDDVYICLYAHALGGVRGSDQLSHMTD